MADLAEPLSPLWWLRRMYAELVSRREALDFYDAYYSGEHPLPWLAPQARQEFRRILKMTRSNYMGLVVDAMVERIQIEGFRFGNDGTADKQTWSIFQANNLDSDSDMGILEAAIGGRSFLLAAPNKTTPALPFVWVEHASQALVAYVPGSNRRTRAAGLKVFMDDVVGDLCATMYLPNWVYKWTAPAKSLTAGADPQWVPRAVAGEAWPAPNPLGAVPLVEVPNNPRLLQGGVSELSDVTDIQDRVNKTIADRLITQDYGAFPQKWATAWPEEDAQGNPTPAIDVGRNRMVTTETVETRFGQWDAAPLDPYSNAKREDVKDIASRTRTPAQYLLGEMSNVNGSTLAASESGLVAKVRQRRRPYAEAFEEAMRLARLAAGIATPGDSEMETIFSDPQYRTEAERTDAVIKKFQSGLVPLRQAREDLGYSATQIARMEAEDASDTARTDAEVQATARRLVDVSGLPAPGGPGPALTSAVPGGGVRMSAGGLGNDSQI